MNKKNIIPVLHSAAGNKSKIDQIDLLWLTIAVVLCPSPPRRASRWCAPPSRSAGTTTRRPAWRRTASPSASMTWSFWTRCRIAPTQRRSSPRKSWRWMKSKKQTLSGNTAPPQDDWGATNQAAQKGRTPGRRALRFVAANWNILYIRASGWSQGQTWETKL